MTRHVIPNELNNYFYGRYVCSLKQQIKNGVYFNLSFDDYLELIDETPLLLLKIIDDYNDAVTFNRVDRFPTDYVLTWRSYTLMTSKVMDKSTACYTTKKQSKRNCMMKVGENHTEFAKDKIRKFRTNRKAKKKTKLKMSAAKIGVKQSAESVAKRKATWAAKKAQQEQNKIADSLRIPLSQISELSSQIH